LPSCGVPQRATPARPASETETRKGDDVYIGGGVLAIILLIILLILLF
jgi:hypothetical protein